MKRILYLIAVAVLTHAQGNWTTYGGDPQRSGWEKNDPAISKATVKDLQLLWKMKLETKPGPQPVYPPLIVGRLISYKGFKELAIVGTNSDMVYAIDADLGKMFWQKHLEYAALEPQAKGSCAQMAMPTMPPPAGRGGRGAAPAPAAAPGRGSAFIGGGGPASVYAISSDGRLHRLNVSTGDDMVQPVSVLPPNAHAYSLNMADNVIYTVTGKSCNDVVDAIWAIDLNVDPPKITSSRFDRAYVGGLAGTVIGADGTVYVQTSVALMALNPRDLTLKQAFTFDKFSVNAAVDWDLSAPVVFPYKNRELIVIGGKDRLIVLDSASLREPLYTMPQNSVRRLALWGNLSTWEDSDGTRRILAPMAGFLQSDFKGSVATGAAPRDYLMGFKVEEQDGKTVLTQAWVSRDLISPQSPVVIANGVVFALSAGGKTHATLCALDAATGKELYSSRNLITSPASLTGMTVANGRVYFGTTDGTLYAFGIYVEH